MTPPHASFLEGVRLYNAGEFFDAHEAWEDAWRVSTGQRRDFLQGLIQATVAMEHYRRGNARGAVALWSRCHDRLRLAPSRFMGVNVRRFLDDTERIMLPLLRTRILPKRGAVRLDLAAVPKIHLEPDDTTNRPLRIGLIADAHCADAESVGSRYYRRSIARLLRAVVRLNHAEVDLFVQLGDLIDGRANDAPVLARAQAILRRTHCPAAHILGNHDVVTIDKPAFLRTVSQPRAHFSMDIAGVHLVFLDSAFRADGTSYDAGPFDWKDADLPLAQRQWLADDLASSLLPALVFLHHRLDAPADNPYNLRSAADIRGILESSRKVRAVLQGHDHVGARTTIHGIDYITLPAMVEGPANDAVFVLEMNQAGGVSVEKVLTPETRNPRPDTRPSDARTGH